MARFMVCPYESTESLCQKYLKQRDEALDHGLNATHVVLPTLTEIEDTSSESAECFKIALSPSPYFISLSQNEQIVAVACKHSIFFYETAALQKNKSKATSFYVHCGKTFLDMAWRPSNCPNDNQLELLAITSENEALLFCLDGGVDSVESISATSACWSPCGKLVAIGRNDGNVWIYDRSSFTNSIETIAPPVPLDTEIGNFIVHHINWAEEELIFLGYKAFDVAQSEEVVQAFLYEHKNFIALDEVVAFTESMGSRKHQYYSSFLKEWRMFFVGCSLSADIELLVADPDSNVWEVWKPQEKYQARLPMDVNDEESLPIGLQLVLNASTSINLEQSLFPPCPTLNSVTTSGLLVSFALVDLSIEEEIDFLVKPDKQSLKQKALRTNNTDASVCAAHHRSNEPDKSAGNESNAHALQAFKKIDIDNVGEITLSRIGELVNLLNASYTTAQFSIEGLQQQFRACGSIEKEDFLAWYNTTATNETLHKEEQKTPPKAYHLLISDNPLSRFMPKEGSWRCSACFVKNTIPEAPRCASCEAPNPNQSVATHTERSHVGFKFETKASAAPFKFGLPSSFDVSNATPQDEDIGFDFSGLTATSTSNPAPEITEDLANMSTPSMESFSYGRDGQNEFAEEDESSDEEAERAEAEQEARNAFRTTLSGKDFIHPDDFNQLFKELGSTYCEEDHLPLLTPLLVDGRLPEDAFVNWYPDWLFAEDSEDEDSEDDDDDDHDSPRSPVSTPVNIASVNFNPITCLGLSAEQSTKQGDTTPVCFSIKKEFASSDASVTLTSADPPSTFPNAKAVVPKSSASICPPDTSSMAKLLLSPADDLSKTPASTCSNAPSSEDPSQLISSTAMYPPDTSLKAQVPLLPASNPSPTSVAAGATKTPTKERSVPLKPSTSAYPPDTSLKPQVPLPTSQSSKPSTSSYPPDTSTKERPVPVKSSISAYPPDTSLKPQAPLPTSQSSKPSTSSYPPDTSTKAKPPLLQNSASVTRPDTSSKAPTPTLSSSNATCNLAIATPAYPPDTSVKPKPSHPIALFKTSNDLLSTLAPNPAISSLPRGPCTQNQLSPKKVRAQATKDTKVISALPTASTDGGCDIKQFMLQLINSFEKSVQRSTINADRLATQESTAQRALLVELPHLKQNTAALYREISALDEKREKTENDILYVIGSDSEVHEQIAFGYELFQSLQDVQWKRFINQQPLDVQSSAMQTKLGSKINEIMRCCCDLEQHLALLEEATGNNRLVSSFRAEKLFRVLKQTYEKSKTEYNKVYELSLEMEALRVRGDAIPEIKTFIGNDSYDKSEIVRDLATRLSESERSTTALRERFTKLCKGDVNCRMLGRDTTSKKKSVSCISTQKDPDHIVSKLMSTTRITIPSPVPAPRQIATKSAHPQRDQKPSATAQAQRVQSLDISSKKDAQLSTKESLMNQNSKENDPFSSSVNFASIKSTTNDSIPPKSIAGGANKTNGAPSIDYRKLLEAFYTEVDTEMTTTAAKQLTEYRGREKELFENLFMTHGLTTLQNRKTSVKEFIETGVIPRDKPTSRDGVSPWPVHTVSNTTTVVGTKNVVCGTSKEFPSSTAQRPLSSTHTGASPAGIDPQVRARLVAFYEKHNPSKLSEIDKTLDKYKGREDELFKNLYSKYKVHAEAVTNTPGPVCNPVSSSPFGNPSTAFNNSGGSGTVMPTTLGRSSISSSNSISGFGASIPGPSFSNPSQPIVLSKPFGTASGTCRDRLVQFYQKHNPEKLNDVDKTLAKYAGRETVLFELLEKKYGQTPLTSTTPQSGSVFGSESAPRSTVLPVFGASSSLGKSASTFGSTLGGTTAVFGGTNTLQQQSVSGFSSFASSTTKPSTTTGSGFGSFRSVATGFGSVASSQGTGTGFGNGFGASTVPPFAPSSTQAFGDPTSFTQMRS
uniref:Nuclear pore complex protein putative n=1 Tax=Albugo laibachii Nc14 TaxID=890382 RepID=F0WAQ6_9STRA|nr:nuclear pore complex protein putative [Albugo laibachii Nc14]|eukprot:CCA18228.1 nuclear pore complex protein putative [Albugo laibachii Nc14]